MATESTPRFSSVDVSLPASAQFDPQERDRYYAMVDHWRRGQKREPTAWQELIAKQVIRTAILLDRVCDQRKMMDMSLTDRRRKPKTHHYVMEPEDSRTKAAEFNRYFKVLSQELRSWLQTAMAENVNIEIRGSGPSVQEFFKVLDKGKDADSSSDKP